MTPARPAPHRALRWFIAVVYAFAIFALGVADFGPLPVPSRLPIDKLQHFLAFGAFVWVLELALLELGPQRRRVYSVLVSAVCGSLLELVQSALPHRSAELLDLVADILGALFAAALSALAAWLAGQRRNAAEPHGT
jgi:VanZ family protein